MTSTAYQLFQIKLIRLQQLTWLVGHFNNNPTMEHLKSGLAQNFADREEVNEMVETIVAEATATATATATEGCYVAEWESLMTRLRHKLINELEVEACRIEAIMDKDGKSEMDFLDSMNYTYKRPEDYVVLEVFYNSYKFGLTSALYYLLLDPYRRLSPEQTQEWMKAPEVSILTDEIRLELLTEFIYKGNLECVKLVIDVLFNKAVRGWVSPFTLRSMAADHKHWLIFNYLTDWIRLHWDTFNEINNVMDDEDY